MKPFLVFILSISLAAATLAETNSPTPAEWQSIISGTELKVECLSKKPTNPGYMGCYPTLDINVKVKNNQSIPALDRLAKDPEKMQLLESGKTVPLK